MNARRAARTISARKAAPSLAALAAIVACLANGANAANWPARVGWSPARKADPQAATTPASKSVADQPNADPLAAQLGHADPAVRAEAAEHLAARGPAAKGAIPSLSRALQDENPLVRIRAAQAIWAIDRQAEPATNALVSVIEGQASDERILAAYVLSEIGPPARAAVPALTQLLEEDEPLLRIHAAEALLAIEPADEAAVTALLKELEHGSGQTRLLAAHVLGRTQPMHAAPVIPALQNARNDADPRMRTMASSALDALQPAQTAAQSKQETGIPKTNQEQPPPAIQKLIDHLTHWDPAVRKDASLKLGELGSNAACALDPLRAALKDDDATVRAYAARAILEIDAPSAPVAISTLTDLLNSTQPGVRPLAAALLGTCGSRSEPALPALRRALAEKDSLVRAQVADAIVQIDPTDTAAVEALIELLQDPNGRVRYVAACGLGGIDKSFSSKASPALLAALADEEAWVRSAAATSLEILGPPSAPVVHFTPKPLDIAAASPGTNSTESETTPPSANPEQPPSSDAVPDARVVTITDLLESNEAPPQPSLAALSQPNGTEPADSVPYEELPQPNDEAPADPMAREKALLLTPMRTLTVDIRPELPDEDGSDDSQLPPDFSEELLADGGTDLHFTGISRGWWTPPVMWEASAFCHRPLYFEDINLERHGHELCCIQPAVSAARFFGTVPLLPYLMTVEPQHCGAECTYTLGHYRPGTGAPHRCHWIPFGWDGVLVEGLFWTAAAYAL